MKNCIPHYSLIILRFMFFIGGILLPSYILHAQHYTRTDTIPVYVNNVTLKFPWAGGHNYSQFSDVDLNFDGIKDLFVFDRTGYKITTYINGGTSGNVDYTHAPQYQNAFPPLQYWALLMDYNCDGKEDIFTASYFPDPAGIRVYKNTSTPGNLQFTLVKSTLKEGANFIPANSIGIPAIEDIDNDGDLDILTYSPGNFTMDYYINQRFELGYVCDSLIFILDPPCWGHFSETPCSAELTSCTIINPDPSTSRNLSLRERGESMRTSIPLSGDPDSYREEEHDNGSTCSLCLDMDADGDKEILIGQSNCCNMALLTNGGTPTAANMIAKDTIFPANNISVSLRYNPCGYFLDVNNDGKRDLLVSPNTPNTAVNNESIWYYENTGADNAPVFSRQTRSFLQEDMIDVGTGADPVFFDFDNDGLTDLLVSNYVMSYDSCAAAYSYGVRAYKNEGTSTYPKFKLVNTDYANLSSALTGITSKHLTFGDVDGDSDEDMFVGDYDGKIHYFTNTALAGSPANFVLTTPNYPNNTGTPIDVGNYATPQLMDIDRDGDLDLIVGEQAGNLNYYQNIGTSTIPSYSFVTNSFGGVDVMKPCCTGYSVPYLYDDAGSYKMIIGSEASKVSGNETGWLWFYDSIDGNLFGNFNLVDSMHHNIWEGIRMTVNGKDITGDGRMDLIIGNYCGGVALYLGDTLTTGIAETNVEKFDFTIYPNPTNGIFKIQLATGNWQLASSQKQAASIEVYNMMGEKVHEEAPKPKGVNTFFVSLPSGLGQGIYFCKVTGENFSQTKKLIVLK